MNWYAGNIAEAVAISKEKDAIFVVYVEGQDEMSARLQQFVNDARVRRKLETNDFVAIKIQGDSIAYGQFQSLYKVVPVPSMFFIGRCGTPLEVATGMTGSVEELLEKINRVLLEAGKPVTHDTDATDGQSLTSVDMESISTATFPIVSEAAPRSVAGADSTDSDNESSQKKQEKTPSTPSPSSNQTASAADKPTAPTTAAAAAAEKRAAATVAKVEPQSQFLPAAIPLPGPATMSTPTAPTATPPAPTTTSTPTASVVPTKAAAPTTSATPAAAAASSVAPTAATEASGSPAANQEQGQTPKTGQAPGQTQGQPQGQLIFGPPPSSAHATTSTAGNRTVPTILNATAPVIPNIQNTPVTPPVPASIPTPTPTNAAAPAPIQSSTPTPAPTSTSTPAPAASSTANASTGITERLLSDSEQRIAEVQRVMEEKKREKREEEQRRIEAREAEKQQLAKQKEIEMKNLQERLRRERLEEQQERERIRAQIAADRAEQGRRNMLTAELTSLSTSAAVVSPDSSLSSVDETRLQIRLPGGIHRTKAFPSGEPLTSVREYVRNELLAGSNIRDFALATSYPRREFKPEDEIKTLSDLNLVPNAVVLVLTREQLNRVVRTGHSLMTILSTVMWAMLTPAALAFDYLNKIGLQRFTQRITQTVNSFGANKHDGNVVVVQGDSNIGVFPMSRGPPAAPGMPQQQSQQAPAAATGGAASTTAAPAPSVLTNNNNAAPRGSPQPVATNNAGGASAPQLPQQRPTASAAPAAALRPGYQPNNIRRLQDTRQDDDDKTTYNGNSTQQQ